MKVLLEVEILKAWEGDYKNNTPLLIKHLTGRLQGVNIKEVKSNKK